MELLQRKPHDQAISIAGVPLSERRTARLECRGLDELGEVPGDGELCTADLSAMREDHAAGQEEATGSRLRPAKRADVNMAGVLLSG